MANLSSNAQPQHFLQRSRSSSTPRLCHACTGSTPPPPSSPNVDLRRSKSTAKQNRKSSPSSSSRKPRPGNSLQAHPSAWALSPGRAGPETRQGEERKEIKEKEAGRSSGTGGVMRFLRRRKEPTEKEEAAHQLRIMSCRLLQWRFLNAKRDRALRRVTSSAERKIFFALLKINELRNIVAAKRILIERRKHKLKLARILNPQLHFLNQWEPLANRHLDSVTGLSRVLEAVSVPLLLTDGAQGDLVLLHDYISMSMEIMVEIEAAVRIFCSKVEELSTIMRELVETVTFEMEGIKELMKTSELINTLEMHETSLRANLIQALMKKEI